MAHPRRAHRGAPALLSALALAACGGGEDSARGYLYDDGTGIRLCEALAESYPPQCGVSSLRVEGELPDVEWTEAQGVRWTDEQVELSGEIENGLIRVGS
jgi:hypothetical protein